VVQAGRLPNPHFAMMRTSLLENGVRHYSIEQVLTINVFALITMPQVLKVERRRFEQAQRMVTLDMLRIASDTRKTYYSALAAEEAVRYARQVNEVAQVGADLARRMQQVGNFNKLQQAREQGFYADATLNLARAEHARVVARERLTRLLGLWGQQTQFELPERLPDLPKPIELPDVEQTALAQRIDLQMVRLETEALASNLGLTRATRFLNVLEAGPAREREGPSGSPWAKGYEISFEIPLFDFGTSKVARAEAIYMQAVNRAADAAINARSEVREAYLGYRTNYDIARQYRDEIVPLRRRIADENLLRYNGMLIGVFELLADARSQIVSVNASIEALRDFWIAQADLEMALIGRPNIMAPASAGTMAPEAGAAH
jgi:outer membrane protein TolC